MGPVGIGLPRLAIRSSIARCSCSEGRRTITLVWNQVSDVYTMQNSPQRNSSSIWQKKPTREIKMRKRMRSCERTVREQRFASMYLENGEEVRLDKNDSVVSTVEAPRVNGSELGVALTDTDNPSRGKRGVNSSDRVDVREAAPRDGFHACYWVILHGEALGERQRAFDVGSNPSAGVLRCWHLHDARPVGAENSDLLRWDAVGHQNHNGPARP
jgi:hypothetical protein